MSRKVEQILDFVYRSAVEPERWPDTLALIADSIGYASGCLIVNAAANAQPAFYATRRTERELGDFIAAGLFVSCARRLTTIGRGRFAHEGEFPASAAKRPAVETLHRLKLWDQTATQHCEADGRHFVFTFEREECAPAFSRSALGLLNQLRPHLIRSVLLGLPANTRSGPVLRDIAGPAFILGPVGRVLETNSDALSLQPPILSRSGAAISLRGWEDSEAIRAMLAEAALARRPATVMLVPREHGFPSQSLQAVPTYWRGTAAQLVSLAPTSAAPNLDALSRRFGLTHREAELAGMLGSGCSLSNAAQALAMSRETARHHLKQIFQKTDTHRQGELIAMMSVHPVQSY